MWSVLSRGSRSRKRTTVPCAPRSETAWPPCVCSTCWALPKHRVAPRQPRLSHAAQGLSHKHHPNGLPFVAAQDTFHPHHRPPYTPLQSRDSNNITAAKESERRRDWGTPSSFPSKHLSPCGLMLTTTTRVVSACHHSRRMHPRSTSTRSPASSP